VTKTHLLPGFTAEATLYRTREQYAGTMTGMVSQGGHDDVFPQFIAARRLSRATGPFGPIGLPGQDCEGACWHICMSFPSLNCWESCRQGCHDFALA
jgi:hypothetical protein